MRLPLQMLVLFDPVWTCQFAAATDAGADTDAEAPTSGPLLPSLPPPLQSY